MIVTRRASTSKAAFGVEEQPLKENAKITIIHNAVFILNPFMEISYSRNFNLSPNAIISLFINFHQSSVQIT